MLSSPIIQHHGLSYKQQKKTRYGQISHNNKDRDYIFIYLFKFQNTRTFVLLRKKKEKKKKLYQV